MILFVLDVLSFQLGILMPPLNPVGLLGLVGGGVMCSDIYPIYLHIRLYMLLK